MELSQISRFYSVAVFETKLALPSASVIPDFLNEHKHLDAMSKPTMHF